MSGIQHEWTLNGVTAVALDQAPGDPAQVLAGSGAHLRVLDAATGAATAQCRVFDSQTVHGIAARRGGSRGLVLWGARSFVVLDSRAVAAVVAREVHSLVARECVAPDWILDAALSPVAGARECVFVTAHCALVHATLRAGALRPQLRSLSSPSPSVLYSAHIIWTSATAVLVAAGTMFGEIEVIAWDLGSDDRASSSCRLFTFIGHEGSIFGVQISPEIVGPDGRPARLLASCSDDRTIRVWDISAPPGGGIQSSQAVGASASPRETGFGAQGEGPEADISAKRSVAAVMGHASRIWKVKFLTSDIASPIVNILSFGEDATCQQWSLDSWGQKGANLTHQSTFAYHSGKHIWSVALQSDSTNRSRLATGGADGKVSLYDIYLADIRTPKALETKEFRDARTESTTEVPSSYLAQIKGLTLEEILSSLSIYGNGLDENLAESARLEAPVQVTNVIVRKKRAPKSSQDTFNRYCFVTKDELLMTTSFGRVLLGSIRQPYGWHELKGPSLMEQDLKSYSVVLGIPEHGTVFLAGANGAIYLYRYGEDVTKICEARNKVAALFDLSTPGANILCILISTLGSAEAQLLSLQSYLSEPAILNEAVTRTLALPPKFVVTSAGNIRGLVVLGSRNGSLAVYDQDSSNTPLHILPDEGSQNDDAITAIINLPYTPASHTIYYFLVTRRNGSYYIYSLPAPHASNVLAGETSLVLLHQSMPPLGPMIEAAWFHNSNLLLYGFRSKSFVVWNDTEQCEVASVECGGAHRSYAYSPLPGADGAGHLAYTRASKLYLHSQSLPSHAAAKRGGHGREIKACAVLDREERKLVATGAEDTTIRIWSYEGDQGEGGGLRDSFRCSAVIIKHRAGIQHLQWCRFRGSVDYLFSAGGNEEFYVWAVSPIPGFGLGIVCEATLTDQSGECDLRIMSFDAAAIADQEAPRSPAPKFRLALAYSDSTIKIFEYSRSGGFRKLAHGRYTSNCLTQVGSLEAGDGRLLLTAATDGYLVLWDVPFWEGSGPASLPALARARVQPGSALPLRSRTRLHQSSILALDTLRLCPPTPYGEQGTYTVVASGGDDNALSLALFSPRARLLQRLVVPAAHAAALTGVAFVGDGGNGCEHALITVGVDQRVRRWRVEVRSGEDSRAAGGRYMRIGKMQEGDDVWCSVADAAGLVTFRTSRKHSHCLVYGAGMEMFKTASDGV